MLTTPPRPTPPPSPSPFDTLALPLPSHRRPAPLLLQDPSTHPTAISPPATVYLLRPTARVRGIVDRYNRDARSNTLLVSRASTTPLEARSRCTANIEQVGGAAEAGGVGGETESGAGVVGQRGAYTQAGEP